MLFPSKSSDKEYYLSDADNINEGKFITTDNNNAVKKTEGDLAFWRVSGKDVHYSDQSIGKTIRRSCNELIFRGFAGDTSDRHCRSNTA